MSRIFWIDCARALAIISITCNHALSRSFATEVDTLAEYQSMAVIASFIKAMLYVFSRLGVPLFLMITGVLLIPRNYEDKNVTSRFIKHNWFSLFRTTEIWFTIMFLYLCIGSSTMRSLIAENGVGYAIRNWIETLLFVNQTTMNSMWYMAMILIVYLMIPVFSIAVKRLGDNYLFALCVVLLTISMIVPNINTMLMAAKIDYTLDLALSGSDLFSYYVIYVLLGYWIGRGYLKKLKDITVVCLIIISFLITSGFQFFIYSSPIDYHLRYADTGIVLISVLLFEIIRRKAEKVIGIQDTILFLSKISFGIYFTHICIMTGMTVLLDRFTFNHFSKFAILEVGSFLGSVVLIVILSRINIFKRYLFMIKE